MPAVKQARSLDMTVVVDHQAEPVDLDRFLDALDKLVSRRLLQRNETTSGGAPEK